MKFYAVAKGRKPGIYLTWEDCKKQVDGFSGSKYKRFDTKEEAESFYAQYNHGTLPKEKRYADEEYQSRKSADAKYIHTDTCVLCGRPFKQQRGKNNSRKAVALCRSCKNRQSGSGIRSSIKHATNGTVGWLTADELVFIKKKYGCNDVFSYAVKHPAVIFEAKQSEACGLAQRELFRNRKQPQAITSDTATPEYIYRLLGEGKVLIDISGDKRDPRITFRCKRCQNDFTVKYRNLAKHKGHNCSAQISSGEGIVREYLEELDVKFYTQQETLKCINPDTGYPMPYDFEIPSHKIIIEVQGEQHRTFIEHFHVDMEGFIYRQQKDAYKKKYAEDFGYKVIEIWYDDFKTGKYKSIINQALGNNRPR